MMNVCNVSYTDSRQLLGKKNPNKIASQSNLQLQQNQNLNVGGQLSFKGAGAKSFLNSETMFKAAQIAANGVLLQSAIVCFINCIPRPLTIMAMPGAKPEDKKYAAVKSIASGCTDFAISGTLFYFIKKGLDKWTKHPDCEINKWASDAKTVKIFKAITVDMINWGLKYGIGIPQAFLMFAIIPPIMKAVFPNKGKKADAKAEIKADAVKPKELKASEKKDNKVNNSSSPIKGLEQLTQKVNKKAGGNV